MIETPDYRVEGTEGPFEIRSYGPMLIAEATVSGDRRSAINDGFRLIAAYIFGANDQRSKIAMTAPVQQSKHAQPSGGADEPRWKVSFVMPSNWTLETLPKPVDSRVVIRSVEPKRYIVSSFSGRVGANRIDDKVDEIRAYTASQKIGTMGEPLLAFYNPPWSPPFLRRNEVMLELTQQDAE